MFIPPRPAMELQQLLTVTHSPTVIISPEMPGVKPERRLFMAVCAVCQAPCRGVCQKGGARLCANHQPASARARCALCTKLGTGVIRAVQAIAPSPGSAGQASRSSVSAPSHAAALVTLALPDQLAWIDSRRPLLLNKQVRGAGDRTHGRCGLKPHE